MGVVAITIAVVAIFTMIHAFSPSNKNLDHGDDLLIQKGKIIFWHLPEVYWFTRIVGGGSVVMFLSIGFTCSGENCIPPFGQTMQGNSESWAYILHIFSVPLKLLAASVGVLGVIALNHRAVQTNAQMVLSQRQIVRSDLQIKETQKQNSFANHFKHMDDFEQFVRESKQEELFSKYTNTIRHFYRHNFSSTKYAPEFVPNVTRLISESIFIMKCIEEKPRQSLSGMPPKLRGPMKLMLTNSNFDLRIENTLLKMKLDYKYLLINAIDEKRAGKVISILRDIIKIIHITVDFQGIEPASSSDHIHFYLEEILKSLDVQLNMENPNNYKLIELEIRVNAFLVVKT